MDRDASSMDRAVLQSLQEDLLRLKHAFPALRLHKTSGIPGAPFPITVKAAIPSPASNYDIDAIEVITTITRGTPNEPNIKIQFRITSEDLPLQLRQAVADELQAACNKSADGGTFSSIANALALVQSDFTRLLCLMPEFVERYEGTDASGRTERRVTILNDATCVTFETDVKPPPREPPTRPPLGRPSSKAQQCRRNTVKEDSSSSMRPAVRLPSAAGGLQGLEDELRIIQRRHFLYETTEPTSTVERSLRSLSVATASTQGAERKDDRRFTVSFVPSDPQWQPPGTSLVLECQILPAMYPAAGSVALALLPSCLPQLSADERAVFNRLLETEVASASGKSGALRAVLRRCDNRGGEMLHLAADIAAEVARKRTQQTLSPRNESRRKNDADKGDIGSFYSSGDDHSYSSFEHSLSHSEASLSDSEGGEESGGIAGDEAVDNNAEEHYKESKEREAGCTEGNVRGLHLQLQGLQLVDIDSLDIVKLVLQVACTRCGAQEEMIFEGTGTSRHMERTAECQKCHMEWSVSVGPRIVHSGSNVLAVVRPEGCAARDMLPSTLAGQCGGCSGMAAFRGVQIGRWAERQCGHCHRRMALHIEHAVFAPFRAVGAQARGSGGHGSGSGGGIANHTSHKGSAIRSDGNSFVITPGQPLPDKGACKHYRHSYRWLRFGCCGKRFACDLCHEEGTDGHEMKWATRMVCGYCSTEQPVEKQCSACGKTVSSSASRPSGRQTQFWEGGQGQRDLKKLSKRDPHKYRGSKAKTRSKKDLRVGENGKTRVARAAGS